MNVDNNNERMRRRQRQQQRQLIPSSYRRKKSHCYNNHRNLFLTTLLLFTIVILACCEALPNLSSWGLPKIRRGGASSVTATIDTANNDDDKTKTTTTGSRQRYNNNGYVPRLDFFQFLDQKDEEIKTRISDLASYFEPAIINNNEDIDTISLLNACKEFAKITKNIGLKTIAKDLESNIKKIESLYDITPKSERTTMYKLLKYERDHLQIHDKGGILKDPSGAIGFLWIRRNIEYQYIMYKNLLLNDKNINMKPKDAATDAYTKILEPYHKLILRKIYSSSLSNILPSTKKEMLCNIGGFQKHSFYINEENAIINDLLKLINIWKPLLNIWKNIHISLDLEDTRRVPI